MTVKSSIALTDEQHGLVRELVKAGHYLNISAVLQQGTDLLRQREQDEDLERAALKAFLDQRACGCLRLRRSDG